MRISDWSSDVCSSDLAGYAANPPHKESTSVHTASGASVSVGAPVSGSDGGGLTGGQQRDNSADMAGMEKEGVGHAAEYATSKTSSFAQEQKTEARVSYV